MPELSERALTTRYVIALFLIAFFTVLSHLTLNHVLNEDEGSAHIINMSTRQVTLSQRVASMAAQYALGVPGARRDLRIAIARFEQEFHVLARDEGGAALDAYGKRRALAIYRGGLSAAVRQFIGCADHVEALAPDDPRFAGELHRLLAQARKSLPSQLRSVALAHVRASEVHLQRLRLLQYGVMVVILAVLLLEALGIFRPMIRRVMDYANRLRRLATIDDLTGLLNRREFLARAARHFDRTGAGADGPGVLLIDVDHFKAVNDRHGHAAGDAVLRAVGRRLRQRLRPGDIAGRLGGEEFAVVVPGMTSSAAADLARRLCRDMAELRVTLADATVGITISVGVASAGGAHWRSLEDLLRDADRALYRSKAGGRNCVTMVGAAVQEPATA